MIIVIVAGGSGTRLWPLSTAEKPKHLLRLTGERSLLQNTYERALQLSKEVYVLTDESHDRLVKEQLPQLSPDKFIIEPGRRGTASCITLALAQIAQNHGHDSEVAFFHADHHINDTAGFTDAVKKAVVAAREHNSIALIGIKPTYASTGFGYIEVGEKIKDAFWVDTFKEKPNQLLANKYFKNGNYLWNLGLFAAPIETFLSAYENHAPDLAQAFKLITENLKDPAKLKQVYSKLKNQPIDTALIEKTPHVVVVPGKFDWLDIGSYKDLHSLLGAEDKNSNTILGDDSLTYTDGTKSSLIMAYNKPVAVIGLKDVVVIDTEEGVLVCHKDHAQSVKKAAKKFDKHNQ